MESNVERSVAALLYVAVIMDIVIASLMVSVSMGVDRGRMGALPSCKWGDKRKEGESQRHLNMAMSLSFSAAERMARRTIC